MSQNAEDQDTVDILLVDDRRSNLIALRSVLEQPGYNLVEANSGDDALNQVLRQDFAVILMDVAMPGMDGFETASIIKQRDRSRLVPIIFVTASVYDMEHVFRGYTVGAVDYLRKPVDPHQLRAKVAVFVELYRQKRQITRQTALLREIELREQKLLRERAEQALRESEAVYQLTFEEAPVGIGHADRGGGWLKANARLREMIGADSAAEVTGGLCDLTDDEDTGALRSAFEQLNAGEIDRYTAEHMLKRRHGGQIWANVRIVGARTAFATAQRYIVVIDDISERKQLELDRARLVEELQKGIRVRDDFISIAAHELKTPVTPLRLQTGSLLRSFEKHGELAPSAPRLREQLQAIDKAASRLEALVDKLLDVSQISVGELTLQLEEVDLTALVRDALERLDGQQGAGAISVDAPVAVVGCWDRVRLEQIFMNLVQNAIRYGAGNPIHIRVEAEDGVGRLSVRDRGVGIPPEAQDRVFERFGRVASVDHFGGFGLGLWIVRKIVEAHGGHISLRSELEQGAEFTVELPLRPALSAPGSAQGTAARARSAGDGRTSPDRPPRRSAPRP